MIEIVQFRLIYYKVGDIIWREPNSEFFDELILGLPEGVNVEDVLTFQPEKQEWELCSTLENWLVNHSFIHFEPVSYLGNSAEWIGMEEDANEIGTDTFIDALPEISRLADEYGYLYSKGEVGSGKQKVVTVMTVWSYECTRSYDGEHDTSSDLIGAFRLNDITSLIKSTPSEVSKGSVPEIIGDL